MKNSKIVIYAGMIIATIIWSLSFIWYKEVFVYLKPITTVFLRLVFSGVFLVIISLLLNQLQNIQAKHLKTFLLLTLFEPFLYFIGESVGMQYVSSTMGAIIISTIPLFIPFTAYYFLGEKLSLKNFLGIIISIVGVLLVILSNSFELGGTIIGISIMFMAVFSALIYVVILMKLSKHYSILTIITFQNGIGAIYFLPVFLIFEYQHFRQVEISWDLMTPLLELSFLASGFAFIFFTIAMKKIGVSKANVLINLIPVFTAIFAYFMLGEQIGLQKIFGIVLVISGLFLSQMKLKSKS